ncbi:MAG: hypothetical protein RBS77_05985 [Candidatus Moranbacteria bacterium]|jgi:hypothetical protein|nr:hypothetical protein [Candidatus Moranbacteria bacterium]
MSIEKFPTNNSAETPDNERVSDYHADRKVYNTNTVKSDLEELIQSQKSGEVSPETLDYEIRRMARLLSIEKNNIAAEKVKALLDSENFEEAAIDIVNNIEPAQSNNVDSEFIKNRNTYILDETKNDLGVLAAKFTKADHIQHYAETGLDTVKAEVARISKELNKVVETDESKDLAKTLEILKKCRETDDEKEAEKLLTEAIFSF